MDLFLNHNDIQKAMFSRYAASLSLYKMWTNLYDTSKKKPFLLCENSKGAFLASKLVTYILHLLAVMESSLLTQNGVVAWWRQMLV